MAIPPNPRIYMADDWAWSFTGSGPNLSTAWQNFYVWDGHGGAGGLSGYGSGAGRGYAFGGESSSGYIGWTIIDLDTQFEITSATCGMCFGENLCGTNTRDLCYFRNTSADNSTHVFLVTDASNHIVAKNGASEVLGTSDFILPASAPDGSGPTYHIEVIVTVHASAGTVQVWVNDILVLDLTGKNTKNASFPAEVGHVVISANGGRKICEWFVHDGTARLGSQWRVGYIPVATAGTYTGQTSGTVVDVNDVSTASETEDANYVVLDATGTPKKASFVSGALPATWLQIRDVHPQIVIEKSDGGTCTGKTGLKSGATEVYTTSAYGVPDAWVARRLALRTDPAAGTPLWTLITAAASEVIVDRET